MSFVEAIRGAISVEEDSVEAIDAAIAELCETLLSLNRLASQDLVSAVFTATPDLHSQFPAASARKVGWSGVPMLCAQELSIAGAPPRMLRVLAHVRLKRRRKMKAVYLGRAVLLRPDLATSSRLPAADRTSEKETREPS